MLASDVKFGLTLAGLVGLALAARNFPKFADAMGDRASARGGANNVASPAALPAFDPPGFMAPANSPSTPRGERQSPLTNVAPEGYRSAADVAREREQAAKRDLGVKSAAAKPATEQSPPLLPLPPADLPPASRVAPRAEPKPPEPAPPLELAPPSEKKGGSRPATAEEPPAFPSLASAPAPRTDSPKRNEPPTSAEPAKRSESPPRAPAAASVTPVAQKGPAHPFFARYLEQKEYFVRDGDTLENVATRLYGDRSMTDKLRTLNPGVIRRNGELEPGATLKLP